MEFKANNGIWGNMFGVPCVVADNLLKIVDGEHIKVLLYILRNSGKDCSEEEISVNTGVEVEAVIDAVKFWQQANVITPQQNSPQTNPQALFDMTPPVLQQTTTENITESPAEQQKNIPDIPKKKVYTGREILQLKQTSADIVMLLKIVQNTLGTVSHAQTVDIINMYKTLGMKKEVIMVLVNYCKSNNEIHDMYGKAEKWFAENINTNELAIEKVQLLDYIQQVGQIMKINSAFSEQEQQIIGDWFRWNMTIDMIKEAYDIALSNDKLSIAYMNGIIKNWRSKGILTLKEVQENNQNNNTKTYDKKSTGTYNKKSRKKKNNFDVDMYKICINNF